MTKRILFTTIFSRFPRKSSRKMFSTEKLKFIQMKTRNRRNEIDWVSSHRAVNSYVWLPKSRQNNNEKNCEKTFEWASMGGYAREKKIIYDDEEILN